MSDHRPRVISARDFMDAYKRRVPAHDREGWCVLCLERGEHRPIEAEQLCNAHYKRVHVYRVTHEHLLNPIKLGGNRRKTKLRYWCTCKRIIPERCHGMFATAIQCSTCGRAIPERWRDACIAWLEAQEHADVV